MFPSLVLAAVLSAPLAPASSPRAAASAETVIHIPRLNGLAGLSAFLQRAGAQAAMLRPAAWAPDFHPFLTLDPTRPETLTAAGVDLASPATLSVRPDGQMTCLRLLNAQVYQARAAEQLKTGGEPKASTVKGVTTVSAPRSTGGRAGYALKGQNVCAFSSTDTGDALLKEAVKLVGRSPAPDARLSKVPGTVFLLRGNQVAGLDGTANGLQVEGISSRLPLPPFQGASVSPYGAMKPEGLLFWRAHVAPEGLAQSVGSLSALFQRLCTGCAGKDVSTVAQAVTQRLTGHVLLHVQNVKVRDSLRTPEGRFFAPRQALAAEVLDGASVKSALTLLSGLPGVTTLEDGWALPVKGGTVFLRLKGKQLVFGNDEALVQGLLAALPEQGAKLSHAAEFTVDPKLVARGLSQVSMLDIMSDTRLAGIFALSAEMGPLLAVSERMTGWLDNAPGGGHRFSLTWTLPPAAP